MIHSRLSFPPHPSFLLPPSPPSFLLSQVPRSNYMLFTRDTVRPILDLLSFNDASVAFFASGALWAIIRR